MTWLKMVMEIVMQALRMKNDNTLTSAGRDAERVKAMEARENARKDMEGVYRSSAGDTCDSMQNGDF